MVHTRASLYPTVGACAKHVAVTSCVRCTATVALTSSSDTTSPMMKRQALWAAK